MKIESITTVLMNRDELTRKEAETQIEEVKEEFYHRLDQGEMPFDILEEYFGLEPDYIMDLF